MSTHSKLGFSEDETKEVVDALNKLLANYQVHYQKLRNFHWNVVGKDFFELHEQFEQEYEAVKLQIDEIAERIRVFGKRPISTMKGYLETAEIEEAPEDTNSDQMVAEILKDFELLFSFLMDTIDAAGEIGDSATEDLATGYLKRLEQRHWMLTAWSK